jgi:MoxR-like ATPase
MTAAAAMANNDLEAIRRLRDTVSAALEGKDEAVELALVALLARGHLLIEDVPGVGKTTLARALAHAVGGELRRVQFTSDMLPSDIVGVSVFDQRTSNFVLRHGPIFGNVVLADEINRASPRTQSALLEAMNEGQVSLEGQTLALPDPFFVIATQNPSDFAGTFPLPESQLDRFLIRLRIGYPPPAIEARLLVDGPRRTDATTTKQAMHLDALVALQHQTSRVSLDPALAHYIQALVQATRSSAMLALGVSPRGALALAAAARARAALRGRTYCIADDIQDIALAVLAHRVRLATSGDGYCTTRDEAETIVRDLIGRIPVPL